MVSLSEGIILWGRVYQSWLAFTSPKDLEQEAAWFAEFRAHGVCKVIFMVSLCNVEGSHLTLLKGYTSQSSEWMVTLTGRTLPWTALETQSKAGWALPSSLISIWAISLFLNCSFITQITVLWISLFHICHGFLLY